MMYVLYMYKVQFILFSPSHEIMEKWTEHDFILRNFYLAFVTR